MLTGLINIFDVSTKVTNRRENVHGSEVKIWCCRTTARMPYSLMQESLRLKTASSSWAGLQTEKWWDEPKFCFPGCLFGLRTSFAVHVQVICIKLQKSPRSTKMCIANCFCHWFLFFLGKSPTQPTHHFTYVFPCCHNVVRYLYNLFFSSKASCLVCFLLYWLRYRIWTQTTVSPDLETQGTYELANASRTTSRPLIHTINSCAILTYVGIQSIHTQS